jgi:hypothetical protein
MSLKAKGFTLESEALNMIGGGETRSELLTSTNCFFSSRGIIYYYLEA